MDDRDSIQSLLGLRKLTRAIAEALRGQLVEHLTALTPILRAEFVFGARVQGGQKDWIRRSDQAFKELQAVYETVAQAPPIGLRTDLTPPFDLGGLHLEITPAEYAHIAKSGSNSRRITVRCPLTWTLTYKGFAPPRLRQLLASRIRAPNELQRFVLAYLMLSIVVRFQPEVVGILNGLRFLVTTTKISDFGELPVMRIAAAIKTARPSDAVMLESAELTGMDAFEEVVRVEHIQQLCDPLKEQLFALATQHAPDLVAALDPGRTDTSNAAGQQGASTEEAEHP